MKNYFILLLTLFFISIAKGASLPSFKIEVSKKELFVGEGVIVDYVVIGEKGLENSRITHFPRLENFRRRFYYHYRSPLPLGKKGEWKTIKYKVELFPIKAGDLVIDPMRIEWSGKVLETPPQLLKVKTLPRMKIKGVFLGLVGKEHSLSLFIPKAVWRVGEMVPLRLTLKGHGALEYISFPSLFPNDWKIYDQRTSTTFNEEGWGERVIDFRVYMESPGSFLAQEQLFYAFSPYEQKFYPIALTTPSITGITSQKGHASSLPILTHLPATKSEGWPWERYAWIVLWLIMVVSYLYRLTHYQIKIWWEKNRRYRELLRGVKRGTLSYTKLYRLWPNSLPKGPYPPCLRSKIRSTKLSLATEEYFIALAEKCEYIDFSTHYFPRNFKIIPSALLEVKKRWRVH